MGKDGWMYAAIALAAVAVYLYMDEKSVLQSLKGVAGLPAALQTRVNNS
jgi:uncharacterized protein YoxC